MIVLTLAPDTHTWVKLAVLLAIFVILIVRTWLISTHLHTVVPGSHTPTAGGRLSDHQRWVENRRAVRRGKMVVWSTIIFAALFFFTFGVLTGVLR